MRMHDSFPYFLGSEGVGSFEPRIPALIWPAGRDDFTKACLNYDHPQNIEATHELLHHLQLIASPAGSLFLVLSQLRSEMIFEYRRRKFIELSKRRTYRKNAAFWDLITKRYLGCLPVRLLNDPLYDTVFRKVGLKYHATVLRQPFEPFSSYPHMARYSQDSDLWYATPIGLLSVFEGMAYALEACMGRPLGADSDALAGDLSPPPPPSQFSLEKFMSEESERKKITDQISKKLDIYGEQEDLNRIKYYTAVPDWFLAAFGDDVDPRVLLLLADFFLLTINPKDALDQIIKQLPADSLSLFHIDFGIPLEGFRLHTEEVMQACSTYGFSREAVEALGRQFGPGRRSPSDTCQEVFRWIDGNSILTLPVNGVFHNTFRLRLRTDWSLFYYPEKHVEEILETAEILILDRSFVQRLAGEWQSSRYEDLQLTAGTVSLFRLREAESYWLGRSPRCYFADYERSKKHGDAALCDLYHDGCEREARKGRACAYSRLSKFLDTLERKDT